MSHLSFVLSLRRSQAWILAFTGLALVLALVPLLNLLAFEFCFVFAAFGSLAALHLGATQISALRSSDLPMLIALRPPTPALLGLLGRVITANLALLILPLLIISLNGLRVKNCDYAEGLLLFFMLPVLSVVLASAIGALWAMAVPRPRLAAAAAVATLLCSLTWGVTRFYTGPAIFGYDPFAGYFPGTLYDEDVAIRPLFYLYRAYNLLWLGALILGAAHLFEPVSLRLRWTRRRRSWGLSVTALLCLTGGAALLGLSGQLGFAPDANTIRAALGGVRRTVHFDIYHPSELPPKEVELLARDHEFRYAQLASTFGAAPPRISSYIFRNSEEKRALMGAGHTFIAKPWRQEIYIQHAGFPHRVLKHELAHIFAGLWGDPLLKVSLGWRGGPLPLPVFNLGLVEGVAVAADWRPYGEMTGHQMAAALQRIGLSPPLEALFGHGFLTQASTRSYISAGSFCRFLLEREGIKKLTALYRTGGDFQAIYGAGLPELLARWTTFLQTLVIPPQQLQLAQETFRRPSILKRVCGHEVANLQALAGRLLEEHKQDQALEVLAHICELDPDDPAHRQARMFTLYEARRLEAARTLGLQLLTLETISKPMRRSTLTLLGDLAWRAGRLEDAGLRYSQAAALAGGPQQRRLLTLKRWALRRPEEIRLLLREYLLPVDPRRAGARDVHLAHRLAWALPASGLGQYLVGKQLAGQDHWGLAITPLQEALRLGLPDEDFTREARLVLGSCLLITGDPARAEALFSEVEAQESPRTGAAREAADWRQRAHWRRTGRIAPIKHK